MGYYTHDEAVEEVERDLEGNWHGAGHATAASSTVHRKPLTCTNVSSSATNPALSWRSATVPKPSCRTLMLPP